MYLTALVVSVEGTEALVLFSDLNIQKTAMIMKDVVVAPGDAVVVIHQGDLANCMIIGIKE